MPISRRTHHLPFVRNGFSDSAQNFGLETTLKPFGLRRLNKSARALGPTRPHPKLAFPRAPDLTTNREGERESAITIDCAYRQRQ